MKICIVVLMHLCTAYVLATLLVKLLKLVVKFVLRRRLNKGSDTYLKFKNNLEHCIKSGEINSYYSGFQFVKVDKSNDSDNMLALQSDLTPLTKFEKYKLIIYGKSLIDQL